MVHGRNCRTGRHLRGPRPHRDREFGSGRGRRHAPVAVEDFAYPNADKILAEQGILLKSGDGHITLADCASETGLLEVLSRDNDKFCFKVTGTTGYLALELAKVYGVKGNDYTVQIDMTVDNSEVSYDIGKNTWTQVGEAADPTKRPHTLMEIRATK